MESEPAPPPPRSRGALDALGIPGFRWLFASNMAFFLAMGSQQIVRAWLVFDLTGSELALGIVIATVALPMVVMAPFGGVVADRHERRGLIALGQGTVLATECVILILLLLDQLAFWHLLVASGVMGCMFPFIMPARQAIVANLMGRDRLANAVALNMAGMNVTRVVGPALGGFGTGLVGVEATYALGVALYALALAFVLRIGSSRPAGDVRSASIQRNLVEGLAYLRGDRLVLLLLGFGLVPMFLAMPFQNLLVVFAKEIWQRGSIGFGLLSAVAGLGGVLGALWVAQGREARSRARLQLFSMVGFGGFLLAFAQSPSFWPAVPAVLLANVFASIYGTVNNTAIQLLIPDRVRGRVSSYLMMSFSLPMLGTLPVSALAEARGAPFAVSLTAVLAVAVAVLFYAASPALRAMDAAIRRALREEPA